MQRRKIPQCMKTKPKLVIQRPLCLANSANPSRLDRSISISKMTAINKQNEHPPPKVQHRRSLQSIRRENTHHNNHLQSRSTVSIISNNAGGFKKNSYISDGVQPILDYKRRINNQRNQIVVEDMKKVKKGKSAGFEEELQQILRKTLWLDSEGKSKFQMYHLANSKIRGLFQRTHANKYSHKLLEPSLERKTFSMAIHKCLDASFHYKLQTLTNNSPNTVERPNTMPLLRLQSNVVCQRLWEEAEREELSFVLSHLAQCNDYIMMQPNKILHQACRRHKYLEEELFAYADSLSISHKGAQTYTPQTNILQAEEELDRSMRILNRQLIQGQIQNEEKSRMMRDYVLEVRQTYSSILQELMSVIDVKTQQARTFVSKILKWEENYITRKQFLGNLKKDYCHAMFEVTKAIGCLKNIDELRVCRIALQEGVGQLNTIYLLGNSFY